MSDIAREAEVSTATAYRQSLPSRNSAVAVGPGATARRI
jgi:hypothetical protein